MTSSFQSRNRETFDSNLQLAAPFSLTQVNCFNLVIEKLLIPTREKHYHGKNISMFQSRNRETFDSNANALPASPSKTEFQSRNRETFDSNASKNFLYSFCASVVSIS